MFQYSGIPIRLSQTAVITVLLLAVVACKPDKGHDDEPVIKEPPVTLFHNARIYTFDIGNTLIADGSLASSPDGNILAMGQSEAMMASFEQADRVDLQGRTVLPGLIDSHGHLLGLAESMNWANLVGTQSKKDVLERLQEFEQTLDKGEWLRGRGWDQNDWPEARFPERQDLDRLFPDRPVWLVRIDGHAAWVNSRALEEADRDFSGDWNPQGGLIHRDADGQATGILVDAAKSLVEKHVSSDSKQKLEQGLDRAIQTLLSYGLTGVHDPGISRDQVNGLLQRAEQGRLPLRVYAMADGMSDALEWLCDSGYLHEPSGRLVMRSVKLYGDGALGSRGAALLSDYRDEPGNRGLLFNNDETVREHMRQVMSCGLQVGIHAIGDAANRQALDAFAAVIPDYPDNPGRHRIEHVQVLALDDISRMAQLGIIAAMQPTHATSDMYWAEQRIGSDRAAGAYAWRSLLDSKARLAFGSDFPVEHVNPMLGIYAAVSRRDLQGFPEGGWFPEQKLSRHEAIRGFTLDAAYAAFMEDVTGSLETGKKADFIVLDRDIMEVPQEQIPEVQVLQTWLDGQLVYEKK